MIFGISRSRTALLSTSEVLSSTHDESVKIGSDVQLQAAGGEDFSDDSDDSDATQIATLTKRMRRVYLQKLTKKESCTPWAGSLETENIINAQLFTRYIRRKCGVGMYSAIRQISEGH